MYPMKVILFILLTKLSFGLTRTDIKRDFYQKKYQNVIRYGLDYPSKFQEPETLELLSKSYYALKQFDESVRTCAHSINIEKTPTCVKLLKAIKKKHPDQYDFGLAKLFYSISDIDKCFVKISKLVSKHPANDAYRLFLAKTFRKKGHLDYCMEQLWQLKTANQDSRKLEKAIENKKKNLTRYFSNNNADLSEKYHDMMYLHIFLQQQPVKKLLSILRPYYESQQEQEFTEKRALRLANLLLIDQKLIEAHRLLIKLDDRINTPLYRFSYESLFYRVQELMNKPEEINQDLVRLQKHQNQTPMGKPTENMMESPQMALKRTPPFDFSEVKFVSEDDLTVFSDIFHQFKERMAEEPGTYERRYIYRQLDSLGDEIYENEKQGKALDKYALTPEGKIFEAQFNKLKLSIEEEDKKNSVKFNGELRRFEKNLSVARTQKQKISVLKSYLVKWEKLANSDNVDYVAQGAFNAYGDTPEGKRLKKRIHGLLKDWKMVSPEILNDPDFANELDF
jgi:hypothetical protein